MTATEILECNREAIEALCRKFHVARLRVFGSALREDWNQESSDFDFLVEYDVSASTLPPLDRLVGFQMALEELLRTKVDAVDWGSARNPHFRKLAEDSAQLFYAA
ncbi:MAG: nucleotidyltransferase domain-containing protein [Armatimonadetes bacterium]|nr:nucleotidyltransferase domain-containing protein [Armatimonadota bacterium]